MKKKRNFYYTLVLLLLIIAGQVSANNYPVSSIPDSLKKNAFAVIRDHSSTFVQSDLNNATYKVNKVITILNKQGDDFANFHIYGDKFITLNSFSAVVRDAGGNIIKKVKKGDLITSTISESSLATDNYVIFYQFQSPSYPYTIEYSYEQKWKNGIIGYPAFAPIDGCFVSVENANYGIELPRDMQLRFKDKQECNVKIQEFENWRIYTMSLNGFKPIAYEVNLPPYKEVFPIILFAPDNFCYDSFCGNMSTWKDYGLWVSGLLKEKELLSPEVVTKLKQLTENAKDDTEKVRIIYEYLQKNSRYVSVQLGIGGFQPDNAQSVLKTGFGDCKGLSNLMRAMLNAVDIKSHYCEISMKEERLYKDFTNINQTDHAILLVPLKNDSIWLECTTQTLPFGYIHSNIAGHDALVISEEGGKICRLPSYSHQQNSNNAKLKIKIKEDNSIEGEVTFIDNLFSYESTHYMFRSGEREKLVKHINSNLTIPNIHIAEIVTSEEKIRLPSSKISFSFISENFVNQTNNRLFVPICPLNKGSFKQFSSANREHDIVFKSGYSESDTIVFEMPESYGIESLPKNIDILTAFGSLKTQVESNGTQITYIQQINIYAGKHNKEAYKDIKSFFETIGSSVNRKFVIKKQTPEKS